MSIKDRAREFVATKADGLPDEMELYASIAQEFATLEREAAVREREREIADDLLNNARSATGPLAELGLKAYIEKLRGKEL